MQYRRLGKSGLKVSEIGFGSWLTVNDPTNFSECVRKAYDLGINHFDTANIYGNAPHEAEEILGKALGEFPWSSYVLSTKAWGPVGTRPNDKGLSRKHLLSEVERSLRALKTDFIDVFYCHRFDPETDLQETLRTLDDLISQGKILYIGFSEWEPHQIATAVSIQKQLSLHPFSASQPLYNLFDRSIETEILPLCSDAGIGQVVFSPLAQGILTGKYRRGAVIPGGSRVSTFGRLFPLGLSSRERERRMKQLVNQYTSEAYLTKIEKLEEIAWDLRLTLPQLALAWTLRLNEVSSAIIGASRSEQVEENVRASGVALDGESLSRIDEVLSA